MKNYIVKSPVRFDADKKPAKIDSVVQLDPDDDETISLVDAKVIEAAPEIVDEAIAAISRNGGDDRSARVAALETMNKADLLAVAAEESVTIPLGSTKVEIIAAITAARAAAAASAAADQHQDKQ